MSMAPGLACEDLTPVLFERRVDGALRAQMDDLANTTNMGAASAKSGMFETVQYRKRPTFLSRISDEIDHILKKVITYQ